MPDILQEKLLKMEIAPPAGVWEKISASLSEEFVASDSTIASKLDNTEIPAPAGMWTKIENQLQPAIPEKRASKVMPLIYKRIAVAAILIGLISLGVIYFAGGDKQQVPAVVKTVTKTTGPGAKKETTTSNAPPVVADNAIVKTNEAARKSKATFRTISRKRSAVQESVIDESEEPPVEEQMVTPEQAPLYELTTVSALQPVSVSAPQLRDKKGNLILDFATLCNTHDDYINVTGPNGKQTKISSKFLSCIGYMNSNAASPEMDARALRCKSQFEEWRNRLLSEPGFIPTASFFDIIELKDMLQEM